jgi:hypothetical protein
MYLTPRKNFSIIYIRIKNIFKGDTMDTIIQQADDHIKMDFSIEDPVIRVKKVEEILANTPSEKLTPNYLDKLAKYIVLPITKEERKQNKILTDNHMVTINKRETSFDGLIGKLENGEDGIYNMIANDKNIIFTPKKRISKKDVEEIPELASLQEAIKIEEERSKKASGQKAYLLTKQVIEMRQDQYVLKNSFRKPIYMMNLTKSFPKLDLSEKITIDAAGGVSSNGIISLFNPKHISILLCNYSKIKEDCWDKFNSDIKWLMEDLDGLIEKALKKDYPLYYDLLIYKIDGKSNLQIQDYLSIKHGIKHSVEYISSLWRNKIPNLIAAKAVDEYLIWHYTEEEKGHWKKCSKCGQIKLAHSRFFSKNSASKDGFYSICKECRNKKKG